MFKNLIVWLTIFDRLETPVYRWLYCVLPPPKESGISVLFKIVVKPPTGGCRLVNNGNQAGSVRFLSI